jgi:hypothetical protein
MNKEQLAEQYAEGKSSSSVFQEAHKKDFLAGFDLAEELFKPKWISVDEQLPKLNQQVIIKFIKGKQGEVITQGCMRNMAKEIADKMKEGLDKNDCEITKEKFKYASTEEYWVKRGYGLSWYNYSNRKIQDLSKKSNNKVVEWLEIPQ